VKTKEEAAQVKTGDIISVRWSCDLFDRVHLNNCGADLEIARYIIIDSTIGWLQAIILFNGPDNVPELHNDYFKPGDQWQFRRASLIGKKWSIL
jgi:hypothetical protein